MQTNIFTPKVDQIVDDPKESLLVVKNYHFWEMTPGYPTLWVWNFQNMQNIAVFRKVANMSTFCISAQYVRVSLREP